LRVAKAVVEAIRKTGGEISFREEGEYEIYLLGEVVCSRGPIRVWVYESDFSADFVIGDRHRIFDRPNFESLESMIGTPCEVLQEEIALGTYPFFESFEAADRE
jgi:hypothetical protein